MSLAAVILASISLVLSISCLVWLLSKHFSSHTIQMVPLESQLSSAGKAKSIPIADQYQEFDHIEPLDPSEEEYFKKYNP